MWKRALVMKLMFLAGSLDAFPVPSTQPFLRWVLRFPERFYPKFPIVPVAIIRLLLWA